MGAVPMAVPFVKKAIWPGGTELPEEMCAVRAIGWKA
jgi:hypothetical protein